MIRITLTITLALGLSTCSASAQDATQIDQSLQRALALSTLPQKGSPFHAVLQIVPGNWKDDTEPKADYTGQVEIWWAGTSNYRIVLTSPSFHQDKVVNAGLVHETDTGDFLPQWLDTFAHILTDPIPSYLLHADAATFVVGGPMGQFVTSRCIHYAKKTGEVNDEHTAGIICFDSSDQKIESIKSLGYFVYMTDFRPFGKKQIPYTYNSFVLDQQEINGRLTTLEPLAPSDQALLNVSTETPPADQIKTTIVSTMQEKRMITKPPTIVWPPVREGRTEGYMIVFARTDRTGQVREASPDSSDNYEFQKFGMEQALRYKFNPLIVDGIAQQMEMPLVLHFSTHIENPMPLLTIDQMKQQTIFCHPQSVPNGVLKNGEHAIVTVSVDQTGKVTKVQPSSPAPWGRLLTAWESVNSCKFRPYVVNGKPEVYKGLIELR